MSFSPYEAYIPRSTSLYDELKPVSVGEAYALQNNAAHLADECGQVLVNWEFSAASGLYIQAPGDTSNLTWKRIASYGPFPCTFRADGAPFQFRVRCAYRLYSAAAGTGYLRVAVGPSATLAGDARETSAPSNVAQFTMTTATLGYGSGMVEIQSGRVASMLEGFSTFDGNGSRTTVVIPQVYVDVWAISSSTTQNNPRLYGLNVAEYVGL